MATESRIDCLIPGLRARFEGFDFAGAPTLPHLSLLLARGREIAGRPDPIEAQSCALFGLAPDARGELPFAGLSWLADTGTRPDTPTLRADPVHLHAEQTQLRVFHAEQLGIGPAESTALIESLNRHFADDGLRFVAPVPQRWYVQLTQPARLRTIALSAVTGRPIAEALPVGEDAPLWRRRMNEVQMLLHDHPVNLARRAARQPPINSVWFWGAAALPAGAEADYREIVADNPVVAGLARLAGLACSRQVQAPGEGPRLWASDLLAPWAAYGDHRTWLARLAQLDEAMFAPLLRGLRGAGGQVTLYTGSGRDFSICSRDLMRFWRRPRPPFAQLSERR